MYNFKQLIAFVVKLWLMTWDIRSRSKSKVVSPNYYIMEADNGCLGEHKKEVQGFSSKESFESCLLTWTGQAFLHELLLGKASPPLIRLSIFGAENLLHHSVAGFVPYLQEVLTH